MKRMFLLTVVVLFGVMGSVQAQVKVDVVGIQKKIEKLDAAKNDPKKSGKASFWIDYGKAYTEAATATTIGLYSGMDDKAVILLFGKPNAEETVTVAEVPYQKYDYTNFNAYLSEGKLNFWEPKVAVIENALPTASAAFLKAYEMDPSSAAKVKAGIEGVVNAYKQNADNFYSTQKFKEAAEMFDLSYSLMGSPAVGVIDTASAFNAGFLFTLAGEFDKAQKNLTEAIAQGYENEGDAYYYLFHAYFGAKDNASAKQALLTGISKYPKNNKLVEGLIGLYATTGEDPNGIIPYVQQAINDDPTNPDLYLGMGRIYDKLNNMPKAIEAFEKAVSLSPADFNSNFNLGFLHIKNGDQLSSELSKKPITSQTEYNSSLAVVNAAYAASLAPLEKAYLANPKEAATIELLKNVYFRLRDEPGMMEHYNKYNELFKSMQ